MIAAQQVESVYDFPISHNLADSFLFPWYETSGEKIVDDTVPCQMLSSIRNISQIKMECEQKLQVKIT